MKAFGDRLRRAREERALSLDVIASDTRISRRYLEALERSDLEALPGSAFNKGYIRSYARFLGIDPGPILDAYIHRERELGRGTPESEQRMLQELSRLVDQRNGPKGKRRPKLPRVPIWLLAAVLLGIAGAAVWFRAVPRELQEESEADTDVVQRPLLPVPEPEVKSAPPVPSPPPSRGLAIASFGVGTGVVDRELSGRSDRFPEGTRVCFWTRIVGGESGDRVRHVWIHEGRTVMRTDLEVGGPHWRTYSAHTLPPGSTGDWAVEARGADGRALARVEFLSVARQNP